MRSTAVHFDLEELRECAPDIVDAIYTATYSRHRETNAHLKLTHLKLLHCFHHIDDLTPEQAAMFERFLRVEAPDLVESFKRLYN